MPDVRRLPLPLLLLAVSIPVHAENITLPTISVEGLSSEAVPYALPSLPLATTDSGDLVKKLPGANINSNGPLTSIVQYRGLYGDRVNVLVDGVRLRSAGPNSMDSPLSYLPSSRVANVSLYRGIAPVSSGIETIGGTVVVDARQAAFTDTDQFEFHGDATSGYASNGNRRYAAILASEANDSHRFQVAASADKGNNLSFGSGDIDPSQHRRNTLGLGYGFQQDGNHLDLNIEHHDTGATGTAALPMDILFARGETYKARFAKDLANGASLTTQLHYQEVDHKMSNYELRTNLNPARYRYTLADLRAQGINIAYQQGGWSFGLDADQADHNATVHNPNNANFYLQNYRDVERDRYSLFTQWAGSIHQGLKLESGIRVTRVNMDAGTVSSSMTAAAATLANNFNTADRSQEDTLLDLAATITQTLNESLDLQFGLARKQRAPSYQERYLWATMESTAGLADGNNYVGKIDLDPETAYQAELGLDWHTSKAAFSPRLFYHHINNYIQGTAYKATSMMDPVLMLSKMMGDDTPLQFNNVDARLYGADANWYLLMTPVWQLDGNVSYVRGERRDTGDNLYRIAPLTARTMLSYVQTQWRIGVEAVTVAAQNKVSTENNEQQTAGYALVNLSAGYQPATNLTLTAGINNLLDRDYDNHLGGYNRIVDNADIAQGSRLPGLGRSVYAGVNYHW